MVDEDPKLQERKVVEAGHVYLLMNKEYRISRNIRAQWFFDHVGSVLEYQPREKLGLSEEELEVICILPKQGHHHANSKETCLFRILPSTMVTFISKRYRLVYSLDLSPSSASVDIQRCQVLLEEAFKALKNSIIGLSKEFHIPGSTVLVKPEIYVTVIAHTTMVTAHAKQVLVQGYLVTADNAGDFLKLVRQKLDEFEMQMCKAFDQFVENTQPEDDIDVLFGLFDEDQLQPDGEQEDNQVSILSPDVGFVNVLRYGMLALQLLPENSSAGIIVITDGIVNIPDANVFESLLIQLRNSTIACSFLQTISGYHRNAGLGQVPNTELLKFLAAATFGAYFGDTPCDVEDKSTEINVYHQAMLCWHFQKGLRGQCLYSHREPAYGEDTTWNVRKSFTSSRDLWISPLMRKKHTEKKLNASITSVMSVRLREGYTIKDVTVKGESQLEVCLLFPWRENVRVEYVAKSAWPIGKEKVTYIEVTVEGTYEFLHDVTCTMKKPFSSAYRTALVKKYWNMLQGLSTTDQLMVHLHSFSTNPVFYNVPDSIKSGVHLFYLPHNSSSPVLSIQHSSKDTILSQFASFWRPILMLDINIWQKWMHTHRINIILEQEMPLPKNLHIQNSSGRFNTLPCRQALASLNNLLKEWSTFVLMENHSYVRLIRDGDSSPTSFYMLRVTSKPPYMVLRVAFLGGTPGYDRHQILKSLRERILALNFPPRGSTKDSKTVKSASESSGVSPWKPPLQREWAEIKCCILLSKPVDRILIRYERMPDDMLSLDNPFRDNRFTASQSGTANKASSSVFSTLSNYLYHQRWVWAAQLGRAAPLAMQTLGKILSTLTKIRLQEGFHFAHASAGIINMVVEVQMKTPQNPDFLYPCIVQYVLFPPHRTTTRESMSEDDLDFDDMPECDGEMQLVTECWIEPQCGTVVSNTPESAHLDGHDYKEIAKDIFPVDFECISNMITLEHLCLMCDSISVPTPGIDARSTHSSMHRNDHVQEPQIHYVPFPFDLIRLLPRCQQVELLFSMFNTEEHPALLSDEDGGQPQDTETPSADSPNDTLFHFLFEQLDELHDREVKLSDSDCEQFLVQIKQRQRDCAEHPYPFDFPDHIFSPGKTEDIPEKVSEGIPFRAQDSTPSLASTWFARQTTNSSFVDSIFSRQNTNSTYYSDEAFHHGSAAGFKTEQTKTTCQIDSTPKWHCFVKVVQDNHVIVTFVPATYNDLLALLQVQSGSKEDDVKVYGTSSSQEEYTTPVEYQVDSSKSNLTVPMNQEIQETSEANVADDQLGIAENHDDVLAETEVKQPESGKADLPGEIQTEFELPRLDIKCAGKDKPAKTLPPTLPMYVYHCSMRDLADQLVNKWSYIPEFPDTFEDMTFTVDSSDEQEMDDENQDGGQDQGGTFRGRRRSSRRDTLRSSFERRSTEVYRGHEELRNHCDSVSDSYYKCFVSGVYKGLQLGLPVASQDIESAMNIICQESVPISIDISGYLQTVCGHLQKTIEKDSIDKLMKEDMERTVPKPLVRFDLENEEEIKSMLSSDSGVPGSHLHKINIPFNLEVLTNPKRCEFYHGLHNQIRKKFHEILCQWFRPVKSNPEWYFFCPLQDTQRLSLNADTDDKGEESQDTKEEEIANDSTAVFESDIEIDDLPDQQHPGNTCSSLNTDTMSSFFGDIEQLELLDDDDDELTPPLFLHFQCTVKTKKSYDIIGVKNLPTCLGELAESLCDTGPEINLGDLSISLDILLLTLPTDVDLSARRRPHFQRVTSYTSGGGSPPPETPDQDDAYSMATSTEGGFGTRKETRDPLSSLVSVQQEAVLECKEQIEWLLKDEKASAARHIVPLTLNTLEMVAKHVQESKGKLSCIADNVSLQFVYGADQSLAKFVEEFERMGLPGYLLCKEGDYYYLVVDRARIEARNTARKISSALKRISRENSPSKDKTYEEVFQDLTEATDYQMLDEEQSNAEVSYNTQFKPAISLKEPTPERTLEENDQGPSRSTSGSSIQVLEEGEGCDEDANLDATLTNTLVTRSSHQLSDLDDQTSSEASGMLAIPDSDPSFAIGGKKVRIKKCASSPSLHHLTEESMKDVEKVALETKKRVRHRSSLPQTPVNASNSADRSRNSSGTPRSVVSGMGTPSRSRHSSGRRMSWFYTSSHGSCTEEVDFKSTTSLSTDDSSDEESSSSDNAGFYHHLLCEDTAGYDGDSSSEGYEGDSSDSEEGGLLSLNDSGLQRPLLPNFWLLMNIAKDRVNVFFHTSCVGVDEIGTKEQVENKKLYDKVINNVKKSLKTVNQRLLLEDLHNTRMCNSLLVPEADEDITWERDLDPTYPANQSRVSTGSDEEDTPQASYLAASLAFEPGHFACDPVWKHHFTFHPRLKTGPGRSGMSRGVQALRTVLNSLSVNNRKNMFVYKDRCNNVFYLRLNESMCIVHGPRTSSITDSLSFGKADTDELSPPLDGSTCSSMWSQTVKDDAISKDGRSRHVSSNSLRDPDTLSLLSASGKLASNKKFEESIELSVYGIADAGQEICEDLINVLQKRVDDAVLDVISMMLFRNPMCKLTPEDVHFIQRPFSPPKDILKLTVPAGALMQLFALMYYLKQNLLQFVHIPKYIDNKAEHHFQDFSLSQSSSIADCDIFLYNRPHSSGGKGIACIHVGLVDGRGNPVQLISCSKPSKHGHKDDIIAANFESLTSATRYTESTETGKPGPTALIQFNIWERGDIDLPYLCTKLEQAVCHALCDVVLEYKLLTAPICEIPHKYTTVEAAFHSVPSSPLGMTENQPNTHKALKKTVSDVSKKSSGTPVMSPLLSQQSFFDVFSRAKSSLVSPSPKSVGQDQSTQDTDAQRRQELELRSKIQKYECGERGTLHPVYCSSIAEWMEYALKMGVPSVHKFSSSVTSRFSVEFILKDIQANVDIISKDTITPVFKLIDLGPEKEEAYMPYSPSRAPLLPNENREESSLDLLNYAHVSTPGKPQHFIAIGRDIHDWRNSLAQEEGTEQEASLLGHQIVSKSSKSFAKFGPYHPDQSLEKSTSDLSSSPGGQVVGEKYFVPRQRLLLLNVRDKEIILYTYNWAENIVSALDKHFSSLVQWHNARSALLSSILSQKLGLFHHNCFADLANERSKGGNPYIQNTSEVDYLIKYTSVHKRQSDMRPRTGSMSAMSVSPSIVHPGLSVVDEVFRDNTPLKPMHQSSYGSVRDPVHRHGMQLREIREIERKESEKRRKLENVYVMWQQSRSGQAYIPVGEDILNLLKQYSRLVHYVATPLLFSPAWRKKVIPKHKSHELHGSMSAPVLHETKSRSRQSSGASIKSKRSDSNEQKKKPGTPVESPEVKPRQQQEEAWHLELRNSFIQQYMQYLQTLGFVQVQIRPTSPKRNFRPKPKANTTHNESTTSCESPLHYSTVYSLQKTLPGGIMLISLQFRDVYFTVKLYAFECTRLPSVRRTVNPQLAVFFTDECDKLRDLTHVHSFAHDFHLRCIQKYIEGGHPVFKQGYHLTSFLKDFLTFYPYPPSFARNCVLEGSTCVQNTSSSGHHLYDYILNHDKEYKMKAVKMVPHVENEFESEMISLRDNEFALVSHTMCKSSFDELDYLRQKQENNFSVGIVITHDLESYKSGTDHDTLHLKYFILLTSRKDFFPKKMLEKKLGLIRLHSSSSSTRLSSGSSSSDFLSSTPTDPNPLPVSQHIGVRLETVENVKPEVMEKVNYLGYSNIHQAPAVSLIKQQEQATRDSIVQMVDSAKIQCRRDILWQRMLLSDMSDDSGKWKKRSDTEESRDGLMSKLSFTEFEELLGVVTKVHLSDIDPNLSAFCNMGLSWYQNLIKVLMGKPNYAETHRYFASQDGHVQHVAIPNPNYLDTFILVTIDRITKRTEMCAVHRCNVEKELAAGAVDLHAMATQSHIEGFVNACCFHLWAGIT